MESEEIVKRTVGIEVLKSWMVSEGCEISQKIGYFEGEKGVGGIVAKEEIGPGEVLALIKKDVILSTELLEGSELERIFLCYPDFFGKENPEGQDNQFLTLVLYEKQKKSLSKYRHFFRTLPDTIETLTDWSSSDSIELQDPDLSSDLPIRTQKNLSSYTYLHKILQNFPHFFPIPISIREIEWCWRIISTRCFMRSPQHSALIPFADLFNHGESSTGFYFIDQNENSENFSEDFDEILTVDSVVELSCQDLLEINFSVYGFDGSREGEGLGEVFDMLRIEAQSAQRVLDGGKGKGSVEDKGKGSDFVVVVGSKQKYEAGDEVLIEYGGYSNTSLLLHYGFSMLNNRHETFRLKIKMSEFITNEQATSLPLKFDKNAFLVFHVSGKELSRELLRCLRAIEWRPVNKKTSFFSQSDLGLERKVLEKYLVFLNLALGKFETSILQDRCSKALNRRNKFAVKFI